MKMLVAYFSNTGYTEKLAIAIHEELARRGHEVEVEKIRPAIAYAWLREAARDVPRYPSIILSLFSNAWRRHHLRTYNQVEEDIQSLKYPDISEFDRICIGGPKWGQMSYPVARYLQTIRGIRGKNIGAFCTFGGPPLPVFEVELIFEPMRRLIERMGAHMVGQVCVSSAYHAAGLMPLFRMLSRLSFRRPVTDFLLASEYGKNGVQNFCDEIEQ